MWGLIRLRYVEANLFGGCGVSGDSRFRGLICRLGELKHVEDLWIEICGPYVDWTLWKLSGLK